MEGLQTALMTDKQMDEGMEGRRLKGGGVEGWKGRRREGEETPFKQQQRRCDGAP